MSLMQETLGVRPRFGPRSIGLIAGVLMASCGMMILSVSFAFLLTAIAASGLERGLYLGRLVVVFLVHAVPFLICYGIFSRVSRPRYTIDSGERCWMVDSETGKGMSLAPQTLFHNLDRLFVLEEMTERRLHIFFPVTGKVFDGVLRFSRGSNGIYRANAPATMQEYAEAVYAWFLELERRRIAYADISRFIDTTTKRVDLPFRLEVL